MLIVYEVTRDLPTEEVEVETRSAKPRPECSAQEDRHRAHPARGPGHGGRRDQADFFSPRRGIGHIGLYRDPETLEPVEYYCKLPADSENRELIVLDPMLATGGSASAAISFIKERNCKFIRLVNLIAAPEGIARHPARSSRRGHLRGCQGRKAQRARLQSSRGWATRATACSARNKRPRKGAKHGTGIVSGGADRRGKSRSTDSGSAEGRPRADQGHAGADRRKRARRGAGTPGDVQSILEEKRESVAAQIAAERPQRSRLRKRCFKARARSFRTRRRR